MFKFGLVTNVDPATARVRVNFLDRDGMPSPWLPVLQTKTFQDKFYCLPDINEQVACLMDEHFESGVVLGAVYSDPDQPPTISTDKLMIKFNDGTVIEYDRAAHKLTIDVKGNIEIKTSGGNLTINGTPVP